MKSGKISTVPAANVDHELEGPDPNGLSFEIETLTISPRSSGDDPVPPSV